MDAGMAIAQDHGGGKAVSLSDHGFYEARLLGVVAEGGAHFAARDVDAVLDIEENVLAPEAVAGLIECVIAELELLGRKSPGAPRALPQSCPSTE